MGYSKCFLYLKENELLLADSGTIKPDITAPNSDLLLPALEKFKCQLFKLEYSLIMLVDKYCMSALPQPLKAMYYVKINKHNSCAMFVVFI